MRKMMVGSAIAFVALAAVVGSSSSAQAEDDRAQVITRMYRDILEREPQEQWLKKWTHSDLTLRQVREHLITVDEGQKKLTRAVQTTVYREPDAAMLKHWTQKIIDGHSMQAVRSALGATPEGQKVKACLSLGDLNGCNTRSAECAWYACSKQCLPRGTSTPTACNGDLNFPDTCNKNTNVRDCDAKGSAPTNCAWYACSSTCWPRGTPNEKACKK